MKSTNDCSVFLRECKSNESGGCVKIGISKIHVRFNAVAMALLISASLAHALENENTTTLELGSGVKLEYVVIFGGTFKQGSPATEVGRNADELLHDVTLKSGFAMSKYPITIGQFKQFVAETKYRTEAESGPSGGFGFDGKALVQKKEYTWRNPGFKQTDTHPVVLVTWHDAVKFCTWLSTKSGKSIKLPNESQWEFACRAKTETRFYNGDTDEAALVIAWFKKNAEGGTHPVGEKMPNAFGLFDMCGGVYQWCRDLYNPYREKSDTTPVAEAVEGKPRYVLRGGSFLKDAKHCRSASRYRNDEHSRNADNGFRIVIELGD
ncbi:MAG: formylglycine-generating enzyme family protein [Planctomycetota bacterium]